MYFKIKKLEKELLTIMKQLASKNEYNNRIIVKGIRNK